MKIEFYEEFPNKENLQKLKLIKFKTRLFLAAKSIKEFKKFEKQAKAIKKDLEVAYWPIVKNSYWISPFSNTKDLIELFNELKTINNHLLIDLELPLAKKWKMYLKNIFHFKKNKRLIRAFLEKNKNQITTAEYLRTAYSNIARFLGLGYNNVGCERSLMFYTSTQDRKTINSGKSKLIEIKNKLDYSISLGTLATGILKNEPILSTENIEKDLEFVKKAGFKKVIIFRLAGLNKKYIEVINQFI